MVEPIGHDEEAVEQGHGIQDGQEAEQGQEFEAVLHERESEETSGQEGDETAQEPMSSGRRISARLGPKESAPEESPEVEAPQSSVVARLHAAEERVRELETFALRVRGLAILVDDLFSL